MTRVDYALCIVLIQKVREAPANDLALVREYIKEIKILVGWDD